MSNLAIIDIQKKVEKGSTKKWCQD
jgi:hypothetical protein